MTDGRDEGHLERLRRAELDSVRGDLAGYARILEIGSGSGYQAHLLAGWGHDVSAVDLADRTQVAPPWHPVISYDGARLPFEDDTFDAVFSSNVLEHLHDLPAALAEQARVLRAGGRAVHLMPSPAWRFMTSCGHYPYVVKRLIFGRGDLPGAAPTSAVAKARERGWRYVLRRALIAGPHGEFPSALAELREFSAARWRARLEKGGFEVLEIRETGLFYTGYGLARSLSIAARRRLARALGSACNVFVARARLGARR